MMTSFLAEPSITKLHGLDGYKRVWEAIHGSPLRISLDFWNLRRNMKPSQLILGITAVGVQFAAAATPPGSEPQVPNTLGLAFERNIVQPGELIDQAGMAFSSSLLYS